MRSKYVMRSNRFATGKAIDGVTLITEFITFIPDVTIECKPPFIKGKEDSTWVTYREDNEPKSKQAWERLLGMTIQELPLDKRYNS